ncbi:MAG TPA: nickel pincer cofactor biosynthesis protein LarB [Candidatus Polarisedimenticolaceae bacterium]
MDQAALRRLLLKVRSGTTKVEDAIDRLRGMPADELGFATLDMHRALRRGIPEAVYGAGKSVEQIVAIVGRFKHHGQTALVTRVGPEVHAAVAAAHPEVEYHAAAQALVLRAGRRRKGRPGVVVMTAGTSDLPIAEEAALTAELLGESVHRIEDVGVAGLHRLFRHRKALESARVIVVVAGMEGALPSVVAGLVDCPIVGVPTSTGYGTGAGGYAALLAMLNSCSAGVAVVNINNGYGAGVLASLINRNRRSGHRISAS